MSTEVSNWVTVVGAYAAWALLVCFGGVLVWLYRDFQLWSARLGGSPESDSAAALAFISRNHRGHYTLAPPDRPTLIVIPGGRSAVAQSLHAAATSGAAWQFGPAFTGVALVLTFLIIGHVMQQLDFGDVGASNVRLNQAVREMGDKFWISAVGVFTTLLYQAISKVLRDRLHQSAREYADRAGRLIIDERAWERDLAHAKLGVLIDIQTTQTSHLKRLGEQMEVLMVATESSATRLANVDNSIRQQAGYIRQSMDAAVGPLRGSVSELVSTVGDIARVARVHCEMSGAQHAVVEQAFRRQAESADSMVVLLKHIDDRSQAISSIEAALQGGLQPMVQNVEKMAERMLGEGMDELVQRFQRALGDELSEQMAPLRDAVHSQSKDVANQFESALSGGATEATRAFHETMAQLNAGLPAMLEQVQAAALRAQEANQQAFSALTSEAARSEARLSELQAVVGASVGSVRTVVDALVSHAREVLHRVASQTEGAVQHMASQTAQATVEVVERFDILSKQLAETQQMSASDAARERQRSAEENRTWVESLGEFNKELSGVTGWLRTEREAVKGLASEMAIRATQLEEQRRVGSDAVERALGVGEVAQRLLADLRQLVEQDHKLHADNRVQIAEIRSRREELETALHRIATEVATVLGRELKVINEQMDTNAQLVRDMATVVSDKLVLPLGETVQELNEAVDKLGRAPPFRPAATAGGGPR